MTPTDHPPIHPLAELMPLADDATLDALADDVARNGLADPIVLLDGAVLDGRNRLAACRRAGVEPTFVDYDGDPAKARAWVLSKNLARRHLTSGQRACLAVEHLLPRLEAEAKERQGARTDLVDTVSTRSGKSRDLAARAVGVSPRYVTQAKALLRHPDLFDDVRAGRTTVVAAMKEREERERRVCCDLCAGEGLVERAAGERYLARV